MRLFLVPDGKKVRITSKLIRWIEHGTEHTVVENTTWTGITTKHYYPFKGHRRRMIMHHSVGWPEVCIWQKDVECEVLN